MSQVSGAVVSLGPPAHGEEATVSWTAGVGVILCAELITAKTFTILLNRGLTAASALMRKVGEFYFFGIASTFTVATVKK